MLNFLLPSSSDVMRFLQKLGFQTCPSAEAFLVALVRVVVNWTVEIQAPTLGIAIGWNLSMSNSS